MPKVCLVDDCSNYVFGKGYCRNHQYLRTDSKKPKTIKKISEKRIDYKNSGRTEIDVFNEIWNERPHISELSGKPLPYDKSNMKMWVCQFLHVIPKGKSPNLRLDKKNILLGTPSEHNKQDSFDAFKRRKFELLKEMYGT